MGKDETGDAEDSSDNDTSSSSSADEEMEQEEDAFLKKLATINEQLGDQPASYDLLVEKIQILQNLGELSQLRNARSSLSKLYPLTPDLWLSWIQDESNLVTDVEGKRNIINLFERAVKDYHAVKIWLQYIQFLRDMGQEGIAECRVVCERALAAMGLHVTEGHLLWDAFREFELELLLDEPKDDQKSRCAALCFRQLGVPLVGMEKSYESIKLLFPIDESAERNYKVAFQKLKNLEEWETKLRDAGNSSAAYREYIEYEKLEKSNPTRIVCLYERAVCDNALDSILWLEYLNYTSNELTIGPVVLELAERASRNCPWDPSIWVQYLHESEKFNGDIDTVRGVLERGLPYCTNGDQSGSLWLKYVQFLRRKIDFQNPVEADVQLFMKTLAAAEEHLVQLIPEPRDFIGEILLYGIRVQAHTTKSMVKPRKLWYSALHKGYGQQFKLWIQFFQLEQRYGEVSSTRKCLEKAISVMTDGLDIVAELWLNFERDFGDLKSVKHAEDKISEFLSKKYESDLQARAKFGSAKGQFQKGKRAWNDGQHGQDRGGEAKRKKFNNNKPRGGKRPPGGREVKDHDEPKPHSSPSALSGEALEKKTQRRPQKSFIPRSLQVQHPTEKNPTEATVTTNADTQALKKPLSNADFRNLFKKPETS